LSLISYVPYYNTAGENMTTGDKDIANLLMICYYDGMDSTISTNEAQALQAANEGWGVVGHEHTINTLRRAILSDRVRHAYLFTGPEHIGKTLLVRRFAQTLLCTGGPDPRSAPQNPCNTCLSCRKVMHGNHPDVHYIARPPDKQFILIDQVRALQSDSARKTMEGRRNIFIITGMHEMNVQAANCLLKTLEEPEPDVVLLLTTTDPGLLLPTILSRVQQLPMHLLTTMQIKAALEQYWSVEEQEAALIAALAAGRMGWAVQAVEDEDMLANRKAQLESLARLPLLSRTRRFDVAQQLSADSDKLRGILELWLLWWRDMVLAAHNSLDLIVNVDMANLLEKQATKIGQAEAQRMVRAILGTIEALDQNVNARTALEVLMLDLPSLR
jgi:DNA polymerase-3 subunit delta'